MVKTLKYHEFSAKIQAVNFRRKFVRGVTHG